MSMSESALLKKFTFQEIEKKVKDRENIPNYRNVLMECKIGEDEEGVIFNMKHPSWTKLIQLVNTAPSVYVHVNLYEYNGSVAVAPPVTVAPLTAISRRITAASFDLPSDEETKAKASDFSGWLDDLARCIKTNEKLEISTSILREIVRYGIVPSELRPSLWSYMLSSKSYLNVDPVTDLAHLSTASSIAASRSGRIVPSIFATELDLSNQRVVHADVERTRPNLLSSSEEMEYLLTMFCKQYNISYKQGMNYLLGIFYMVPLNKSDRYSCFCVLVDRFMFSLYADEEFGALQCSFRLFRVALLYHDPELYDMTPELYASPWFLTFFANRLAPDIILRLVDLVLSEDDPLCVYWLSIALICSYRESIFKHSNLTLPETLTGILIKSEKELNNLWNSSRLLRSTTPITLISLMTKVASSASIISVNSELYKQCHAMVCAPVSPNELVDMCFLTPDSIISRSQSLLKFFILDCRSCSEYESGHLPCAYSLDATLLQDNPEEFTKHVQILSSLKGSHFCLFFDDFMNSNSSDHTLQEQSLLIYLLSRGFRQISLCEGGYRSTHAILCNKSFSNSGVDFIDHNHSTCFECNPSIKPKPNSSSNQVDGFLSVVRERVSSILGKKPTVVIPTGNALKSHRLSNLAHVYIEPEVSAEMLQCCQLPSTVEVKLLLTVLRNKSSTGSLYTSCLVRLLSLLFAQLIESAVLFEKIVSVSNPSGRDSHHSGVYIAQPIAVFIVSDFDGSFDDIKCNFSKEILQKTFDPFSNLISVHYCYAKAAAFKQHKLYEISTPSAVHMEPYSSTILNLAPISEGGVSYSFDKYDSNSVDTPSMSVQKTNVLSPVSISSSANSPSVSPNLDSLFSVTLPTDPSELVAINGNNGSTLSVPSSLVTRYRTNADKKKSYYEFAEFKTVLYLPSISTEMEVLSIIRDLNQGGIGDDGICIVSLVCGQIALRVLKDAFPKLRITVAVIDEIVQTRLSPGFGAYIRD